MNVLVLGAGGIGGYFGGRLVENGVDVTFLVRDRRRAQLEGEGLRIESMYGAAELKVKVVRRDDVAADYDFVLLACKAYDLSAAIEDIAPALAPTGAVLPLLNGIAHLETLNERFGRERVLGGVAKIAATLTRDGVVRHLNDWNFITIGEQDRPVGARVQSLVDAFPPRTVRAYASGDVVQDMWEKLVHLATAASMTCLMRANVGEIVRTPQGAGLFGSMLTLVAETAARNGHPPGDAFLQEYRRLFSDPTSTYATSMLRDLEAGNQIEAEHIVGFVLDRARAAGLDATLLDVAYTHLKAYENRRRR